MGTSVLREGVWDDCASIPSIPVEDFLAQRRKGAKFFRIKKFKFFFGKPASWFPRMSDGYPKAPPPANFWRGQIKAATLTILVK